MKTNSIVCHLGDPRSAKPQTLQEYGKLREVMIQRPWACLSETDFIEAVTKKGQPFYQALMSGRDLMELSFEKLVWRTNVLAALDFDVCDVSINDMIYIFSDAGIRPWLSYKTFSDGSVPGKESYRLLWRTEVDLNTTYEETARALKKLRLMSGNLSDKFACNATRLWQGTNKGAHHYDPTAPRLNLKQLAA
jgi:hypothetical protein